MLTNKKNYPERSSLIPGPACLSETAGEDPARKSLSEVRTNLKELAPGATTA